MTARFNPFNAIKHPHTYDAWEYANSVVKGEIVACSYVIGACLRFLNDLTPSEEKTFYFDVKKSEKYLKQVQKFHHVKGKWSPPQIIYLPWQKFVKANIMGFIDKRTGERRFRIAHVEVPRGQGKSPMAAQSVLYFLALDEPVGNEISCIASKTDQAKIVLNSARNMAKKSKDFLSLTGVEVREHTILHDTSNSIARALSSDDKSLDGLTDVLAVMDELHAIPRDLYDVVTSGMRKRNDSLVLCITTAGFNKDNSGFSQSNYAKKVALGQVKDDTFFAIIYTIDEGDDYFAESTWKKANPSYGFSVDPISFKAAFDKARVEVGDLPGLLVKNLNVWLDQASSYFDMAKLDACIDPNLKMENFKGKRNFGGVDLATVDDLCVQAWTFRVEGKYYIFTRSYIAEKAKEKHRREVYEQGEKGGFLKVMEGEVVDLDIFQDEYISTAKEFNTELTLFDPFNATQFSQGCQKKRLEMVEMRQTLANFSEPTKKLHSEILKGNVVWNGSPITRWCFGNVVVKPDSAGNVRPLKPDQKAKIDEVIAIIMSFAPWLQEKEESAYESRGIRTV